MLFLGSCSLKCLFCFYHKIHFDHALLSPVSSQIFPNSLPNKIHSFSFSLKTKNNSITQKTQQKSKRKQTHSQNKKKKNFVSYYQLLNASWLRIRLHINLPRSVLITLSSLYLCRQCACCFSLCDFLSPSVLLCLEGSGFLTLIIILPLLTNSS